ncbi:MAG: hypothetical protein MK365_12965 [Vicinamibacterales bacterium]|nr:hypothetical protein [Vicinamibacterales bacterium]
MRQALRAVDGVVDVEVSYDDKRADVRYRPDVVEPAALVAAVDGSGFSASVRENDGAGS